MRETAVLAKLFPPFLIVMKKGKRVTAKYDPLDAPTRQNCLPEANRCFDGRIEIFLVEELAAGITNAREMKRSKISRGGNRPERKKMIRLLLFPRTNGTKKN